MLAALSYTRAKMRKRSGPGKVAPVGIPCVRPQSDMMLHARSIWLRIGVLTNKRGIANPVKDYASGSLRLAAYRREWTEVLQVASHSIILPGDPPLVALWKSDHRVVCGTCLGVFY